MMDRDDIKAILPHREPFLLVDRILSLEPGITASGELDVNHDLYWVPGHFPNHAVMPGVFIVEACAQVGAVILLSMPENAGRLVLFAGVDKVRFKRQVVPGDVLAMTCSITKRRGPIGWGAIKAWVGEELACSGELMFAIT
jgi:3-hydroxyacyl-[acyl-carrier-protein] dehydratase